MARKKVRCDPQIAHLANRFLILQDNSAAKKTLAAARKRVQVWRYGDAVAFPDNPTAIQQPNWVAKRKRGTFPHGFTKAGDLVFIEWVLSSPITVRKDEDHLEVCFVNVYEERHTAQVVRHVYRDHAGEPVRALNLYYGGGFDRRFAYTNGRLDTITTEYWEHDDIRDEASRRENARTEVEPIRYTKAGEVKGTVRSKS